MTARKHITTAAALLALACARGPAPSGAALAARADAASPAVARSHHTVTLLADGRVVVAGGADGSGTALASVELVDPSSGRTSVGSPLAAARRDHTATLLADGRVLVAGGLDASGAATASTEILDPASGTWTAGPALSTARAGHTATRLATGTVHVAGGSAGGAPVAGAESLAPGAPSWADAAPLAVPRSGHAATLLADGTVLVTGGDGGAGPIAEAERYDPASDAWAPAAAPSDARSRHVALRLADGRVLAAGGDGGAGTLATSEIYDPTADSWAPAASMNGARADAAGVLLPDGRAVVLGGLASGELASVESFDPGTGAWTPAPPLASPRAGHAATVLLSGRILVSGGVLGGVALAGVEIVDLASPAWSLTGTTSSSRRGHTATLLPGGKVLVAGGQDGFGGYLANAQLFDPASGAWTDTGSMLSARTDHTATLLDTGLVLVAGGAVGSGAALATAELYDPSAGSWHLTGGLSVARAGHSATLLPSGVVLVAGGESSASGSVVVTQAVELYDTGYGGFVLAGSMALPRAHHTATLLPGGDVLMAGGEGPGGVPTASCERWVSNEWKWVPAPAMGSARSRHAATLLEDGRVLVSGGTGASGALSSTEIFDPSGWSPSADLAGARSEHAAVLLVSGEVLVVGGRAGGSEVSTAERFDPWSAAWSSMPDASRARSGLTLTVVPDGRVLLAGGDAGDLVHVAEVLDEGRGPAGGLAPSIDGGLPLRTPGAPLALTGAGLAGGPEAASGGTRSAAADHPSVRLEGAAGPVLRARVTGFAPASAATVLPGALVPGWYWVRPVVAGAAGVAQPMLAIPQLKIAPGSAGVPPRGQVAFSATGSGSYTWSLDARPSGGSIDAATGVYTAGATGRVTDVVRVTDLSGNSVTAAVDVGPALAIGGGGDGGADPGAEVQFTATGGSGQGFLWSLAASGAPSGSTIDPVTGVYTAGPNRNTSDLVVVTDSLGNSAQIAFVVWPEWRLGAAGGCNCGTGGASGAPVALLVALLGLARLRRRGRGAGVIRAGALASAVAALALAGPARAQSADTSIVLERFSPLSGSRDVLGVGAASVLGHLERGGGVSLSFASRPLQLAAPGDLTYAMVQDQATATVAAWVGLFDRGEIGLVASGAVSQSSGHAANVPPGLQPPIAGSGLSDLRVIPKVRVGTFGPLALAFSLPVGLPTGRADSFLGAGAVTVEPRALAEADLRRIRLLGSIGYAVRPSRTLADTHIGNAITYGLAAEAPFRLAGQALAVQASVAGERGATAAASPLEALGALRWTSSRGLGVVVGGGHGISSGYGSPEWRGFLAVTFAPLPPAAPPQVVVAEPPPLPAEEVPAPEAVAEKAQARRTPVSVPLPPPPPLQVDRRIYFGVNETSIPARYYPELQKLAAELAANPKPVRVVVAGHADEIGAPRHNQALSEQRAAKVRLVLQQAGVPGERIHAEGFGDTRPAVPGRHAMNRRVEIRIE